MPINGDIIQKITSRYILENDMKLTKIMIAISTVSSSVAIAVPTNNQIQSNSPPPLLMRAQTPTVAPAQGPQLINRTVAVVNEEAITLNQINQEVVKLRAQMPPQQAQQVPTIQLQQQALQQLINQNLMMQMAKRQNITVSEDRVQAAISQVLSQNNISEAQLRQQLSQSGISFDTYRQTIRDQLIISELQQQSVASQVYISPQEIQRYIDRNITANQKPTEYLVKNILLTTNQNRDAQATMVLAQQIVDEVRSNKLTFQQAAKEYSDSSNAQDGGSLGWRSLENIPSAYQDAVIDLTPGQVSQPISTEQGIQIIYLAQTRDPNQSMIEQFNVSQIVINLSPVVDDASAKAQLQRIINAIKNGASFADQAKANSQSPDTASKGGDMGWQSLQQMNPQIAEQVKSLAEKTVSQPFKVGDSWQIIIVNGKRDFNNTAEVQKMQAVNALFQQKAQQAIRTWMISLRENAYIKVLDSKLDTPEQ